MEKDYIYRQLMGLPSEDSPDFEVKMMDVDFQVKKPEKPTAEEETSQNLEKHLDEIIETKGDFSQEAEKAAFAAFCIRVTILRRNQNYTQEMQLLNQYEYRFRDHPLFNHFYVMGLLDTDLSNSAEKILKMAKENADRFPDNPGVQHLLVFSVVEIFERTEFCAEKRPDPKWISAAAGAADRMLEINPNYAKYHCTKGRFLALNCVYDQALDEIHKAIDLENSSKSGYSLRINSYRAFMQYINTKQNAEKLKGDIQQELNNAQQLIKNMETEQEAFREKTRKALNKNTEFLGLFAGVVSFTIGGLDIAGAVGNQSFRAAAGLIIVLLGALLWIFVGLDYLLHAEDKKSHKANLVVIVMSVVFTLIGVYLCS